MSGTSGRYRYGNAAAVMASMTSYRKGTVDVSTPGDLDLVRLDDGENGLTVRVLGRWPSEHEALEAEIAVRTPFIAGTLITFLTAAHLDAWGDALAQLAEVGAGADTASWHVDVMDGHRQPRLNLEAEEGEILVSVHDVASSGALARFSVVMEDLEEDWVGVHRGRLARVREAWPLQELHP